MVLTFQIQYRGDYTTRGKQVVFKVKRSKANVTRSCDLLEATRYNSVKNGHNVNVNVNRGFI